MVQASGIFNSTIENLFIFIFKRTDIFTPECQQL